MKFIIAVITLLHGFIHLLGFAKAFQLGNVTQLTKDISKPTGIAWLVTAILFTLVTALQFTHNKVWPVLCIITVVLSQVLIITSWSDAKFGTIANCIILVFALLKCYSFQFKETYQNDVKEGLAATKLNKGELLTDKDILHLPVPVQKFIAHSGALNQPKIKNMKIVFEGEMRGKDQEWFAFQSEQYNFFDTPTRLFFMTAKMKGLPVAGYHAFKNGTASMLIKVLSLIPVMDFKGDKMNKAETVTYFNDLCIFAPGALTDKRIQWEMIDSLSCRARFTNNGISISANLFFNEKGELINFISNDRYAISSTGAEQFPFITPVKDYKIFNGYTLGSYGEAIWKYPEGEFCYGKFRLKSIEYNVAT